VEVFSHGFFGGVGGLSDESKDLVPPVTLLSFAAIKPNDTINPEMVLATSWVIMLGNISANNCGNIANTPANPVFQLANFFIIANLS